MSVTAKRLVAAALLLAGSGALVALYAARVPHEHETRHAPSVLDQTLLAVDRRDPVSVPALVGTDGKIVAADRLRGRWSLVFFGFTSCPDVCPTTLQVLSTVARDPASGVSGGGTQIVFVTVDPERDTPERMRSYLEHFGGRILGFTGTRTSVDLFAAEVGAASRGSESGIDHSTSLFVLDPKGRLAGILLRPADPARIVADLNTLQAADGGTEHISRSR